MSRRSRITWLILGALGILFVCGLIPSALNKFAPFPTRTPTRVPAVPPATRGLTRTPGPTLTPKPTNTVTPTVTPTPLPLGAAFQHPAAAKGFACFSASAYGLSCLDETGWHTVHLDLPDPHMAIYTMAVCPDNSLLVGHSEGASRWDGKAWTHYPQTPGFIMDYVQAVACSPQGELWATYHSGASRYDGAKWTAISKEQILAGYAAEVIKDFEQITAMRFTPDGDLWALIKLHRYTDDQTPLVRFDGRAWQGVDAPDLLLTIATGSQGDLWGISEEKLYEYAAGAWKDFNPEAHLTDLVIDTDDRAWITTSTGEILVFDQGSWLRYDATDGGKIGPELTHLALDGLGRLWAGSKWGLSIFDGTRWTAYHMHTADIADYEIGPLAVIEAGPDLPAPVEKASGSARGRIVKDGQSLAGITVEACQYHFPSFIAFSTTPCNGKPFLRQATTDEAGVYQFADLPPGYYRMFYQLSEKDWEFGRWFLVEPGKELENVDINAKD